MGKNNEKTCAYINTKELCGDPVENQEDKTAADFCKSCGVGGGDPGPAPTPSPPDDDCTLDDDDVLQLTTKNNEKTCAFINTKELCDDPVPAPTPSPPDGDCTLDDDDVLQLTTKNNEKT